MANETPKYAPVPDWTRISGLGRTRTYQALSDGELKGIKVGRRLLIDVEQGLEWLGTMPAATIRLAKKAA